MPLNPEQGWEILFCPGCGYAIEACVVTTNLKICPVCWRKGEEVELVDRFVLHRPVNKVLSPLEQGSP